MRAFGYFVIYLVIWLFFGYSVPLPNELPNELPNADCLPVHPSSTNRLERRRRWTPPRASRPTPSPRNSQPTVRLFL